MRDLQGSFGSTSIVTSGKPPLLCVAALRRGIALITGRHRLPAIDWQLVAVDMVARGMVGLIVGALVCLLLLPILYWPSKSDRFPDREGRRGVERYSARMERTAPLRKWALYLAMGGFPLIWMAGTRASFRSAGRQDVADFGS